MPAHKVLMTTTPPGNSRFEPSVTRLCTRTFVWTSHRAVPQGMWAELLGLGDFYYELGVQILEAAWATRQHNGGLLELPSLVKYVNRRRGSAGGDITEDDVVGGRGGGAGCGVQVYVDACRGIY